MSMIRQITGAMLVLVTTLCFAAEPQETTTLHDVSNNYPAEIADLPESRIKSGYPENLRNQMRRAVAANKLKRIDGTIFWANGGATSDLLWALSWTGNLDFVFFASLEPVRRVEYIRPVPGDYWTP